MSKTDVLLACTSHRPFPMPPNNWKYYQEWKDTVFLHYKVSAEIVQALLPEGLMADTLYGEAWVSIVAFTVEDMRVKGFPSVPYISDFHEINLRTYVVRNGVPGIYFIAIETNKLVTVLLTNLLIGLHYKKSRLKRRTNYYTLRKSKDHNKLAIKYLTLNSITIKTETDTWLTERYCAYEMIEGKMYRFNIHHKPWPLKNIKVRKLKLHYHKEQLILHNRLPDTMHFAHMQQVLLWGRQKC